MLADSAGSSGDLVRHGVINSPLDQASPLGACRAAIGAYRATNRSSPARDASSCSASNRSAYTW